MKTKLFISIFFVIAVSIYIFSGFSSENKAEETSTVVPPQPTTGGDFLVGSFQSAKSVNINGNYDELGGNLTHYYVEQAPLGHFPGDPNRHTPKNWFNEEYLFTEPINVDNIHSELDELYTGHSSRVLWMRPKIEWLVYGQSSTYQAEVISSNDDYWFYSFQTHGGESIPDNQFNGGNYVLHCGQPTYGPNAGYVLTRLKANTEQCRKEQGSTINQWQFDDECTWLVKPRIRIDSNFAHNNPNTPVCSIKVIAGDGQTILKNTVIKGINFLRFENEQFFYNGQYLEEFYNFQTSADSLKIHGAWTDDNKWIYNARGNADNDNNCSKTDIKVWWYDNCDMWIDYVKVENDVASDLLSNDPLNQNWVRYNNWIADEVNAVKDYPGSSNPAVYAFYAELVEFNNMPCIAYLTHKIDSLSNHKIGLTYDLLCFYPFHLEPSGAGELVDPARIKRMWYDSVHPKQIYLGDPYPINAYTPAGCDTFARSQYSEIPSTLPVTSGNLNPVVGVVTNNKNTD